MKRNTLALMLFLFWAVFAVACNRPGFKGADKTGSAPKQKTQDSVAETPKEQDPNVGVEVPSVDGIQPGVVKPSLIVTAPVDQLTFGENTTATATVKDSKDKDPKVTFSVSAPDGKDPGKIDPKTGVYTSPEKGTEPYSVTIKAVLDSDPAVTGTKTIAIKLPKPELVVSVPVTQIRAGGEKTTATAKFKDDPTKTPVVTWSVKGPDGKDAGTIDPKSGVYTSPQTATEAFAVTITATLDSDPTVTGSTQLNVLPPAVKPTLSVSVKDPVILFGGTTTATAVIVGVGPTEDVTWTVSASAGKTAGTISDKGVYTAPASGKEQYPVTVTATLKSDGTVTASATITLNPPKPELEVALESPEVKYGGNKVKATAKLKDGTLNPPVTWTVTAPAGKAAGSIDANGIYTSPGSGSEKYAVTITATLVADATVKASAPLNLLPDDTVFARCTRATTVFPIVAEVYELPVDTQSLPGDWSLHNHVTTVCMDQYNVPSRNFSEGFPDVPQLFEWFGLKTKTTLLVTKAGLHTFHLNSDDGSKLWINGQLIIDNDGLHAPTAKQGSATLAVGEYTLTLDYFQGPRFDIALELLWKRPGDATFAVVPKTSFK